MKFFIKIFIALVVLSSCSQTTIFIVRHAEKATTPTPQNPDLTDVGKQRAEQLANLLMPKKINNIFSTNFRRTIQTATPLANVTGSSITFYSTDTLQKFIKKIVRIKSNSLIVSHSNKILPMLDSLPITHTLTAIPDNDFDNLFVLTVKRKIFSPIKYSLKETSYGTLSPAITDSAKSKSMQ